MSPSAAIRNSGLGALSAFSGEALQFQGYSVKAIVNRKPLKMHDAVSARDGSLDFQVAGMTEIEVRIIDIKDQPEAGDSFIDSFGFRHRVEHVIPTDITWVCYCSRSQVTPP